MNYLVGSAQFSFSICWDLSIIQPVVMTKKPTMGIQIFVQRVKAGYYSEVMHVELMRLIQRELKEIQKD